MNGDVSLVVSGFAAFLVGTAALALLLPLLRKRRLLDIPNPRSSHTTPTVRGGGIGIAAALVAGLAIGTALLSLSGEALRTVIWFGVVVAAFACLGWTEDARGLSVRTRLGGQIAIAAAATWGGTAFGDLPLVLSVPVAVTGVFYVNAANFMDGVNGISGWHGTVVGAYFATVGLLSESTELTLAGVVTSAAFLSFLPWNAHRPRMFMGDVGSYALGAAAWGLCVLAVIAGTPLLVAVAPVAVYTGDVAFTLLRRASRRARLFDAHREHIYQRVQQVTGSHGASTGVATTATVASAGISLIGLRSPVFAPWTVLFVGLVVVVYLASPSLLALRQLRPFEIEVEP